METNDKFLKYWFTGINRFLKNSSKDNVENLLKECAKSCSDSFSFDLYQKAFSEVTDIKQALDYLVEAFDDFSYSILNDKIQIAYQECGCDLFIKNLITSDQLCSCSEKSLLYNWESIYGKDNVLVKRLKSKICGDDICLFEIKVRQLGHYT